MATGIIDALVVTFALDAAGFHKGEREVDQANKRLRDSNKRTFDEMEQRGKSAAQTFKSVRNEVIGLGLAFMGATTITGLIAGMMSGAAAADRLGQTMGMSAKQIWAWRMAMKGVGGQTAEGDAALATIQKAKMGWQLQGDTGNNVAYSRLGISGFDLQHSDPGAILKKIAAMQGKMDPQVYSSLLQQIGLPQSMVYFLNQGKAQVDKQIAAYEKNSAEQEKLAHQTEDLQKSMAQLQAVVAGKLVPVLVKLVNLLNRVIPGGDGGTPSDGGGKHVWGIPGLFEVKTTGGSGGRGSGGGRGGAVPSSKPMNIGDDYAAAYTYFRSQGLSHEAALGVLAGMFAEGGGTHVKNPTSTAYGWGQWTKSSGRQDTFRKVMGVDLHNSTREQQWAFLLWEMRNTHRSAGSAILGASSARDAADLYIDKIMAPGAAGAAGDKRRAEGYLQHYAGASARHAHHRSTTVHHQTNHYHIKSTDPKGAAHEIGRIQRRHAVAHADRGVAP